MQHIKRILVPVDFSECAAAALEQAVLLARYFDAVIDVLHVWRPPPSPTPNETQISTWSETKRAVWQWTRASARQRLDDFLEELELEGCQIESKLAAGDPAEQIVRATVDQPYDLVVMGTHRRAGLAHLLHRSLASKVVRRAHCQVLTVRAHKRPERITSAA